MFKMSLLVSTQNYTMYLNIIHSEDFLGFYRSDRNTHILLPYLQNVFSNNIVNILGDEAIIIKVNGDCIFHSVTSPCVPSIDCFDSIVFEPTNSDTHVYWEPSFSKPMQNETS